MKKKLILSGIIAFVLAVNIACVNEAVGDIEYDKESEIIQENELLKFESSTIDFSKLEYKSSETERDATLEKAIIDYLNYNKDVDGNLVYYYNNIDLNGDEKEEAFVYLIGQYVSGSGGSTALIINRDNYQVISNFTLVQNPIIISKEKTNGWNDIIMQVSGGGLKASYVKMVFDGETYPSNPSVSPELEQASIVNGQAIIANPVSIEDGLAIK